MTPILRHRAARGITVALLAVFAAAGLLAWALWPGPPAPVSWVNEYDVASEPPELLPPGTVVGQTAPPGWSHLIVKSHPRIAPAERPKVSDLTARMATLLFTAFAADVRPSPDGRPPRHRLRAVGIGLGNRIDGRDTILTPDTAGRFGADLDWIGRAILSTGCERQKQSVVVFRGPTMALVDTPVHFRCPDRHRLIMFRYALLVDEPTGRLDPLVWLFDPTGRGGCAGERVVMELLPPDLVNEPELYVDLNEFTLGVPAEPAFAVDRLPPGRVQIPMPSGLRPLAEQTRYSPEEAARLEGELRKLLPAPTGAR
jgi:hypothetical protein